MFDEVDGCLFQLVVLAVLVVITLWLIGAALAKVENAIKSAPGFLKGIGHWLLQLIQAIIDFFKGLFKPGDGGGTPSPCNGSCDGSCCKSRTYTVVPGDNLSKIAQKFEVSNEELVKYNKENCPRLEEDPSMIGVGWVLCVEGTPVDFTPPNWRENLDCGNREVQKYGGVEYCTGKDVNAHVIVIDLHEQGVRFEYVIAEGLNREDEFGKCEDVNRKEKTKSAPGCNDPDHPDYYPVISLLDTVRRNSNAAAVINTDYGAGNQDEPDSRDHGPEGFTVVEGNRIDGPAMEDLDNNAENRPWLAISRCSPLRAEFGQFGKPPYNKDDGNKPDWVWTGVGGAPWLIRNEDVASSDQVDDCEGAYKQSCDSTEAQTAVALSRDGRWLYLAVVVGKNARGVAQFLHDTLNPWQAIKMDGGGSSQLWYGGLLGDDQEREDGVVYPGDGRSLSQYLAVTAEPGSGIVFDPEPVPPDHLNWWDRFRSEAEKWWDQRKTDFGE